MTLTVGVFSLVAALLIGLLGALLFIVFCVGVALIIMLPTLFFTTLVASFIWLWGLGTYYILKFFNQKDIPGIHTDLKSGLLGSQEESENDKLDAMNPDTKKAAPPPEKKEGKGTSEQNGSAKKGTPVKGVTDQVGKTTGVDVGDVGDLKNKANLGDVQKKADVGEIGKTANVDGVTKKLPTGVLG